MDEHEITIWAYEAPAKHTHRSSGWSFVDNTHDGEVVLCCGRCDATWHTGIADTGDLYDTRDLQRLAAAWLLAEWFSSKPRRQLVMPFALTLVDATVSEASKRRYAQRARVDPSGQMSLFAAAA